MDVDSPAGAPLKRSSSAPMINETLATNMTTSPQNSSTSRDPPTLFHFGNATPTRTRRHSFSPHPASPSMEHLRLTPRISQLRQEESVDHINQREVGHEREIRNNMRNSQSLEDLSLGLGESSPESPQQSTSNLRLIIPTIGSGSFLDTSNLNSPSPTRGTSSGFQSPTRGPSRTVLRRSESPVLRPSPLSHAGKRKLDKLDDDRMDFVHSPVKRHNSLHYPNTPSPNNPSAFPSLGLLTTTNTPTSVPSPNSVIRTTSPHLTSGSLSSGVRTPDDSLSSSGAEESQFSPASSVIVAQGVSGGGDYVMMGAADGKEVGVRVAQQQVQQDHDMMGG